jgi:hypothetical protein
VSATYVPVDDVSGNSAGKAGGKAGVNGFGLGGGTFFLIRCLLGDGVFNRALEVTTAVGRARVLAVDTHKIL